MSRTDSLSVLFEPTGLLYISRTGVLRRCALDDDRIQILVIGMRLKHEIDANIKTVAGDLKYTIDDRALLAEFSVRAYDSDALKTMRVD